MKDAPLSQDWEIWCYSWGASLDKQVSLSEIQLPLPGSRPRLGGLAGAWKTKWRVRRRSPITITHLPQDIDIERFIQENPVVNELAEDSWLPSWMKSEH